MAEAQEELSNTELQESTFDVMSEALDDLHKDDPIVEAAEEVVNDEPVIEQSTESDVKAPTYQEAEDAQQDARSGVDLAEESEEELQASEGVQASEGLDSEDAEVYDNLKT